RAEDAAIALRRSRDRRPDAGVPGRRLHDRAAGPELPVALGRLEHGEPDAILDRSARIEVFELGKVRATRLAADFLETDDRGVADELERGRVVAGHQGIVRG